MTTGKIPVCECHHTEMRWAKDPTMKLNGRWRCRVKERWANRPPEYRLVNMIGKRRYHRKNALIKETEILLIMKSNRR